MKETGMIVIGITGGIGCGKSRVCRYLKDKYGAEILTADTIAHEVIEPDGEAYEAYYNLFGEECLLPDGTFDRKKIGDRAFKDPELIRTMNSIIHPAVEKTIIKRIRQAEMEGKDVCVIEAALLIEAGYRDICREYWYIYADLPTRVSRLLESRDITEEKIESIVQRQLAEEVFRRECEFTVDNSGDFADTAKAIDTRITRLREEA